MNKCSFCGTSYEEILQTGFAGCEKCYQQIDGLRAAVTEMFGGKVHKGRGVNGNIR